MDDEDIEYEDDREALSKCSLHDGWHHRFIPSSDQVIMHLHSCICLLFLFGMLCKRL